MKSLLSTLIIAEASARMILDDTDYNDENDEDEKKIKYEKPNVDGLLFSEKFDNKLNNWKIYNNKKYNGIWLVDKRDTEIIYNDYALITQNDNTVNGIIRDLPTKMWENRNGDMIIQYEIHYQRGLNCGGGYIKLFNKNTSDFSNDYLLQFGPDRCPPETDKVTLVIQMKDPVTQKWSKHELKDSPRTEDGGVAHLYTLHISKNGFFKIFIDLKLKRTGSLRSDFDPPIVLTEKMMIIDDPNDKKPDDWVDEEMVIDLSAVKPDDWEDSPTIPQPGSSKPEGWLDDEPLMIEADDGNYLIKNPKCVVGCGEWYTPRVPNPKYKGIWVPPMKKNDKFIGHWKPKKIKNNSKSDTTQPFHIILPMINSIGFDIYGSQSGVTFDNIIICDDLKLSREFAEKTWRIRRFLQDNPNWSPPAPGSIMGFSLQSLVGYFALIMLGLIGCCLPLCWSHIKRERKYKKPLNLSSDKTVNLKLSSSDKTVTPKVSSEKSE
eukprot:GHVL01017719.1.p1 GENE.GHVL01017719.1~~GHVL01017719.1.p1  ORF type:complete len:490 (+),score=128.39 GHVL01017719.1:52-1521(+)